LDGALEIELRVGRRGAGRADRGDAAGQVEARRAVGELDAAGRRRIERVVVHADEARDHGVAAQVQRVRAGRRADLRRGADLDDAAVLDDDRLTFHGWRAGSVHHAHVGERDDGRVHRDVLPDLARELGRRLEAQGRGRSEGEGKGGEEWRSHRGLLYRVPVAAVGGRTRGSAGRTNASYPTTDWSRLRCGA